MDLSDIDLALKRLNRAADTLEAAILRRKTQDEGQGDMVAELAAMRDDRGRLAAELDQALARAKRLDSGAAETLARIDKAMAEIRLALGVSTP